MANERDTYLRNAREAEAKAAVATTPSIKQRFLELAENWPAWPPPRVAGEQAATRSASLAAHTFRQ